jgi:ATP-dependent DNA helicase Q1
LQSTARDTGISSGTSLSFNQKHALNTEIAALDNELSEIDAQIKQLQSLRSRIANDRDSKLRQYESLQSSRLPVAGAGMGTSGVRISGANRQQTGSAVIDYTSGDWDWSPLLRRTMKRVFKIDEFRLCQEACAYTAKT